MINNTQKYTGKRDLEERTLKFASDVVGFVETLPGTIAVNELSKQLVRSAGSVGANYIEENEALDDKDFLLRLRICRKEAKESIYWLKLIPAKSDIMGRKRDILLQEAIELTKIFGAIVTKLQRPSVV
jgi:four helix bundle protein